MSSNASTGATTASGYLDENDFDLSARILQYVKSPERLSSLQNNPVALLSAMYEFQSKHGMMSFIKPKTDECMREISNWHTKPSTIVEIGTFVGVSAVFWGIILRTFHGQDAASKGCKVFALEISSEMAAITSEMIAIGGLKDLVEVVVGEASNSLKRLQDERRLDTIDLLFLDHWEQHYVPDTKLCENLRLLHLGSVLLADNVDKPGAPAYAEYVRAGGDGLRGYRYTTKTVTVDGPKGRPLYSKDLVWSTVVQAP